MRAKALCLHKKNYPMFSFTKSILKPLLILLNTTTQIKKEKKTKNIISIGVDFELSKILSIEDSINEQWCFDQA